MVHLFTLTTYWIVILVFYQNNLQSKRLPLVCSQPSVVPKED
jgi:hypothetical protein